MSQELLLALEEIQRERGIARESLIEALESALVAAYRKHYGTSSSVVIRFDQRAGRIRVYVQRRVVEEVADPDTEISLEEARQRHPGYQVGDVFEEEVSPRDFGRIAAQTAKQVMLQKVREAERDLIYQEYAQKEGDIVTGTVHHLQGKAIFVDLGKIEAPLPPSAQVPGEHYRVGDRIKVYVVEVRKTGRGPEVEISRSHPGMVKRLFELEVPEIQDGILEIKAIAREAGSRTKIAVASRDERIDPVGACVGPKGLRVQAVVKELHGEKVDIIKWSPDPAEFIANALSPSRVTEVKLDEEERSARVIVPDYQLSLAIGKAGQNARLAAKLTGWKIDIKSESQVAEEAMREALRRVAGELPLSIEEGAEAPFEPAPAEKKEENVWEKAWAQALAEVARSGPRASGEAERRSRSEEEEEW